MNLFTLTIIVELEDFLGVLPWQVLDHLEQLVQGEASQPSTLSLSVWRLEKVGWCHLKPYRHLHNFLQNKWRSNINNKYWIQLNQLIIGKILGFLLLILLS